MTKIKIVIIARALLFWAIFELLLIAVRSIPMGLPKWSHGITVGGVLTVAMILATHLLLKSDKLTLPELGLTFAKGSFRRFFLSFVAGMTLFGCFFFVYLWLTPVTVRSVSDLNLLDAVVVSFFAILMLALSSFVAGLNSLWFLKLCELNWTKVKLLRVSSPKKQQRSIRSWRTSGPKFSTQFSVIRDNLYVSDLPKCR